MPIKWKTTEIETPEGKVKVTHWEKHDPQKLMEALQHNQIDRKGKNSIVTVHKFGSHLIAAKLFWSREATNRFKTLRELERRRLAIVETPVALVELSGEPWRSQIVTLYKKGTVTLKEFLNDLRYGVETKRKAALSAAAKLALLHAAGFTHSHPHENNIVVDKHGNAQLIDYKLIEKNIDSLDTRDPLYFEHWSGLIHGNTTTAEKFYQRLKDHYRQVKEKAQRQTIASR